MVGIRKLVGSQASIILRPGGSSRDTDPVSSLSNSLKIFLRHLAFGGPWFRVWGSCGSWHVVWPGQAQRNTTKSHQLLANVPDA